MATPRRPTPGFGRRRPIAPLVAACLCGWSLSAHAAPAEAPPRVRPAPRVSASAREVVVLFNSTHRIGYGVAIPDGYVDGGRGMRIRSDGRVSSSREVLVVDRERDEPLREALEFSASPEVRGLPVAERARRIAHFVATTFQRRRDRVAPYRDDEEMAGACRGREVLIGDVPALCNTGVCRHQALLYKLMADEAGLDAALVRGGYLKEGRDGPGAHAWCEVEMDDGALVVVDTMRSKNWFVTMKDPRAANYHDVADRPMYGPGGRRRHLAIVAVGTPPFVDAATVRVVPPEAGTEVRYTIDGSEPGSASAVAAGPLLVPGTCVLKAVAFAADGSIVDRASRQIVVIDTRGRGRPAPVEPSAN